MRPSRIKGTRDSRSFSRQLGTVARDRAINRAACRRVATATMICRRRDSVVARRRRKLPARVEPLPSADHKDLRGKPLFGSRLPTLLHVQLVRGVENDGIAVALELR